MSVAVRKGLVCFGKVGSVKAVGVGCGVVRCGTMGQGGLGKAGSGEVSQGG